MNTHELVVKPEYRETHLSIPQDLTQDGFADLLRTLGSMRGAIHWWVGDALVFGNAKFGELAAQFEELLNLTYQQLADYKWVASRVPPEHRFPPDQVSWSHHRDLAKIDDPKKRSEWLQKVKDEGWSRAELRQKLRDEGLLVMPMFPKSEEKADEGASAEPATELLLPEEPTEGEEEIETVAQNAVSRLSVQQAHDMIIQQVERLAGVGTREAEMCVYSIQAAVDAIVAKLERDAQTIEA